MTDPTAGSALSGRLRLQALIDFARAYGVLIIIVLLMIVLSFLSDSFLTARNLLNILNQSTPLALIAVALTLVIIGGGFDLSTGAIFGVASVSAAWTAVNIDPILAMFVGPVIGLGLGIINGLIITGVNVHSFLATLATSLVYRSLLSLIGNGFNILNANPFFKDLTTGLIIVVAVALSAGKLRR